MPALFSGKEAKLDNSCAASEPASPLPEDVDIIDSRLSYNLTFIRCGDEVASTFKIVGEIPTRLSDDDIAV